MEDQKPEATTPEGSNENQPEAAKGGGKPYSILFPPDMVVWNEARRLVTDKNIRVEDLAVIASQDPSIVIELLRTSNAMFFSGGRSPITSVKTAIVRLGSDVVLDTLEKMRDRTPIADDEVRHWFELHRNRCKRTSIVATILSEALARTLTDDSQAAGLLMYSGEMLAVLHLGEIYTKLAEELSRAGIIYRLAQDHRFDVETMGVTYLRRHGIPEALLFALDRDTRSRTPDRAILKPICQAAGEFVDAFDNNRWEKLAPGKTLPPKSALRMLGITEAQYLKIYERVSEYLFSLRMLDEKKKQEAIINNASSAGDGVETEENRLQSEITSIINEKSEAKAAPEAKAALTPPAYKPPPSTAIRTLDAKIESDFSLGTSKEVTKAVPRVEPSQKGPKLKDLPKLRTSAGNQVVNNISNICEQSKTSEELLTQLMAMLVDKGPFEKSALIVISKDRKQAIVVAARGPSIGNGQKLELNDPLSPLAQCFSKVQSFGNREANCSPWGSKAFALAPIDADHDTPVALYADCGSNGSLTFEARRVFRTVVELLNQKLPSIPGGIPVEL